MSIGAEQVESVLVTSVSISPLLGLAEGAADAEGDTTGEAEGHEIGENFDAVGYESISRVTWMLSMMMSGA
jgi:hypothetical protein